MEQEKIRLYRSLGSIRGSQLCCPIQWLMGWVSLSTKLDMVSVPSHPLALILSEAIMFIVHILYPVYGIKRQGPKEANYTMFDPISSSKTLFPLQ